MNETETISAMSPTEEQLSGLIEHYRKGRLSEAERLALSLTQKYPNHPFSWKVLGVLLKKTGRAADSLSAMRTSVELAPTDAEAHSNLGVVLQELGKLEAAEASLKQAIVLKPNYAEAHYNLGVTFKELGRLKEAEASYSQAIALKPDHAEAHNNLGIVLQKTGRLEQALTSLKRAVTIKPDYAEAYNMLGSTLKDLGIIDEAEEAFRKAIAAKSDFAQAHCNLGAILQELGRLEEAEASYRSAIALTTGFATPYRKLACTLEDLGRAEEAAESERYAKFLNSPNFESRRSKEPSEGSLFSQPSPIEYPLLYRPGMGTENIGGFLRAMAQMLRPNKILEIGAGYTTPFLLEALINNERVYDDGNLEPSYFKNYVYDPKLVVIDNMSLGELSNKPGMKDIISSKYTEFLEGSFQGKAEILREQYGDFDFVWLDCGGSAEYEIFMDEYWEMCSGYIFFHFTYNSGRPNGKHDTILRKMTGNPFVFDIVEPHKCRQGSVTMVRKN